MPPSLRLGSILSCSQITSVSMAGIVLSHDTPFRRHSSVAVCSQSDVKYEKVAQSVESARKVIHAFFHSLQGSLKPRSGSNSVKFVTMNWFPLSLNPVGLGASKMDRMTPSRNVSPFSVSWRYPVVPRRISLAHSVTGGSPRIYHRLRK